LVPSGSLNFTRFSSQNHATGVPFASIVPRGQESILGLRLSTVAWHRKARSLDLERCSRGLNEVCHLTLAEPSQSPPDATYVKARKHAVRRNDIPTLVPSLILFSFLHGWTMYVQQRGERQQGTHPSWPRHCVCPVLSLLSLSAPCMQTLDKLGDFKRSITSA
jgi:hypothetical protein